MKPPRTYKVTIRIEYNSQQNHNQEAYMTPISTEMLKDFLNHLLRHDELLAEKYAAKYQQG